MRKTIEKISYLWKAIKRIHFFRTQYPLKAILADSVLFPYDYYVRDGQSSALRNLSVITTTRCNFRCQWCFYREELKKANDLSFQVYERLIEEVAGERPAIVLSGGEPFSRPDIVDFVRKAKAHALPTSIFTNGVLMSRDQMRDLIACGLDYLCISIIGDRELHQETTKTSTYERLMDNLGFLSEVDRRKTKVIFNVTLSRESLDRIEYFVDLVRRFTVDGVRVQHLNFLRPDEFTTHCRVFKSVFDCDLTINQYLGTDQFDRDDLTRMTALTEAFPIPVQEAPCLDKEEMEQWYLAQRFHTIRKCLYVWRGAQIGADASVYPCYKISYPLGSLLEESFYSIWNNSRYLEFRRRLKKGLFPGCARCCKL